MSERHRLCHITDIPLESGRECVAGGRVIAVFRVADDVFALDGICPHAGGPLAKGCLTGGVVTCPWHGWQFDVRTGAHQLTPRIRQPAYRVTVVDGEVFVDIDH
jgi:nitrite reductase (NADH) small subunit